MDLHLVIHWRAACIERCKHGSERGGWKSSPTRRTLAGRLLYLVVAENNRTYSKLSFNVGPGGQVLIPTEIDYGEDFGASDRELWDTEYAANVKTIEWLPGRSNAEPSLNDHDLSDFALAYDFLDEFESMEPQERQFILDELSERPELWDEKEVMVL